MFARMITAAALALSMAGAANAATVTVKVNDVASAKGEVLVQLCDEAHFLADCPIKAKAPAARGTVTVTFKNVPPGRYAAMTFHDENGDKVMNRSKIGVPVEGGGFSRDAAGDRGPPKFSDAVVTVGAADTRFDINLIYY